MVDSLQVTANLTEFNQYLESLQERGEDLRPALESIAIRWFRSNNAMFTLKGPGGFEDLSPKTKGIKERIIGQVYPILEMAGTLKESLTNMNSQFAIKQFLGNKTVELGTEAVSKKNAPYAAFLQEGTKYMPARPPVMIGTENTATTPQKRSFETWSRIVAGYIVAGRKSEGFRG